MNRKYELIVTPYIGGRSWGQSLRTEIEESESVFGCGFTRSEQDLVRNAQYFCKPGLAVIVRPRFNDASLSYHEWRSFDGEQLKRITFTVGELPREG